MIYIEQIQETVQLQIYFDRILIVIIIYNLYEDDSTKSVINLVIFLCLFVVFVTLSKTQKFINI